VRVILLFAGRQTECLKNLINKIDLLVLAFARDASLLQPRHQRHCVHLRQLINTPSQQHSVSIMKENWRESPMEIPANRGENKTDIDRNVRCEGAHPLCSVLSRRGLNPMKLAYDTSRSDAKWPAPVTNRLARYASNIVEGPTVTQNSPFLP